MVEVEVEQAVAPAGVLMEAGAGGAGAGGAGSRQWRRCSGWLGEPQGQALARVWEPQSVLDLMHPGDPAQLIRWPGSQSLHRFRHECPR